MATKRVKYKTKSGKIAFRNIRAAASKASNGRRLKSDPFKPMTATQQYHHGATLAGATLGYHAGISAALRSQRAGKPATHALAQLIGGTAGGAIMGRLGSHLTHKRLSEKSKRRLGLAGSAVGIVGGLAGMHRAQQF